MKMTRMAAMLVAALAVVGLSPAVMARVVPAKQPTTVARSSVAPTIVKQAVQVLVGAPRSSTAPAIAKQAAQVMLGAPVSGSTR